MGRPTLCTPALTAAIVAEMDRGATLELAGEANGLHRKTAYEWVARGNGGEQPFADFADAITRARARAQADALRDIREAVTPGQNPVPDWRARADYLAKANRKDFGSKVEVTQRVEAGFSHVLAALRSGLDQATYQRVCEIMSEALGDDGTGDAEGDSEPVEH